MLAKIEIGSATIHRIIEQEGPFFEAMQFFPTLTRELLDENRRELFGRFCDTPTLFCTAHLPSPSTGRVVSWRDAFEIVDT